MNKTKHTIGNIIRKKRESLHLSRDELAAKIHISGAYLAHIERDAPVPVTLKIAEAVKKELKTDINSLIDQHNVHVLRFRKAYRKKSA